MVTARLTAWWSAWKYVVALAAALAGSLALNYWQHRQALTAPLRAEVAGLKGALDDSQALLGDVRASASELASAADAASRMLDKAGGDYRKAVAQRPITDPRCAPGQGRQDAVNRALGATQQ